MYILMYRKWADVWLGWNCGYFHLIMDFFSKYNNNVESYEWTVSSWVGLKIYIFLHVYHVYGWNSLRQILYPHKSLLVHC